MKALKLLVIVMGVMLVAGVAALAVVIAGRIGHRAAPAPILAMTPSDAHRTAELPAGAKLIAAQSEGDRVMLRLALADGGEELWLIDWKSGARLAAIDLRVGAAKP
jgi:hypothetical protein